MRVLIQRVSTAQVKVDGAVVGEIGRGLLVLVGVEAADNAEDVDWLAGKIVRLRLFNDENGVMNLSVSDIGGEVLVVSQFTLHASTKKGNRPSYIAAAPPEQANQLYLSFVQSMSTLLNQTVPTGRFGADMQVSLVNDGPVTIWIDSKNKQ